MDNWIEPSESLPVAGSRFTPTMVDVITAEGREIYIEYSDGCFNRQHLDYNMDFSHLEPMEEDEVLYWAPSPELPISDHNDVVH